MELQLQIDRERCVGCEECVADCPMGCLEMKDGVPAVHEATGELCLGCHHCLAVCSTGALGILGKKPEDSIPLGSGADLPNGQQMANLIKGRRSIRSYRKEAVSPEDISFLLETVGYAPTAVNNRQVLYTVVEDIDTMDKLRQTVYQTIDTRMKDGTIPQGMEFYLELIEKARTTGRDAIFRGAPHLLIASAPKDSPAPEADCFIGLSYFELLASSMGLGALWCGLAKWALMVIAPELLKKLKIPEDHQIVYMMVFGKPAIEYARTPQRDLGPVNRIQSI